MNKITLMINHMTLELEYSVFVKEFYKFLETSEDYSQFFIPCTGNGKIDMSKFHTGLIQQLIHEPMEEYINHLCLNDCSISPTPVAVFQDKEYKFHIVDVSCPKTMKSQEGNELFDLFILCPKLAATMHIEYERINCW